MNFIPHDACTNEELNKVILAAETQITGYRKAVAQLEQIRDSAKLRLIQREIEACDE